MSSRAGAVSRSRGGVSDSSAGAASDAGSGLRSFLRAFAAETSGGRADGRTGGSVATPDSSSSSRGTALRLLLALLPLEHDWFRLSARPPVRLTRLQPLQRVPRERHQRERGQREKAEQHGAGHPDLAGDDLRQESRHQPYHPGREPALTHVRVEIGRAHVAQHAHDVGHQDAQTHDEDRGALHVQAAQPVEAREREADAEQWNAQGARAEQLPERVSDIAADRSGDLHRQQCEAEEEPRHQRGQRGQPAPPAAVAGREHRCARRGHTGTAARVTRRSWKVGSTG